MITFNSAGADEQGQASQPGFWGGSWLQAAKVARMLGGFGKTPATGNADQAQRSATGQVPNASADEMPRRFWLWVDQVGGYLVYTDALLTIGQPQFTAPGSSAAQRHQAIELLGDLSRRHAQLRREGEGYLIEPLDGQLWLDGQRLSGPALLGDGAILKLGQSVRLRFRQPHPLSLTARLEFVSHHTTQPAADALVLLADSCVLGPSVSAHIPCACWPLDVVLYKLGGRLHCRTTGQIEINARRQDGGGLLEGRASVRGPGFSFGLEPWEPLPR